MALYGSANIGFFLVDGRSVLAAKLQGLTEKQASAQARTDGLGDTWEEHTPTGMRVATLTQDGAFFDAGTLLTHELFRASQGTSRVVCVAFQGNTRGKRFVGYDGVYANAYAVQAALGGLTKADVTYTITGARDEGQIVQPLAVQTVDWNTESASEVDYTLDPSQLVIPITSNTVANPTVVTTPVPHGLTSADIILIAGVATSSPTINGQRVATVISATTFSVPVDVTVAGTGGTFVKANSTGGGVGFQQITAFSGFTGFVGTLRDSTDDVTYAALIAFSNVTSGPGAERSTVAGVVDRYLAFDGNVTGSGSLTICVGFARR